MADAATVQRLMKELNVPGVSIAVIEDFNIAATYAYGVADVETGAAVTPETMFQAASISKPVAAMVSLKAVQEGRFSLDQDVNTQRRTHTFKLPKPHDVVAHCEVIGREAESGIIARRIVSTQWRRHPQQPGRAS
jgi:hypothetical protein